MSNPFGKGTPTSGNPFSSKPGTQMPQVQGGLFNKQTGSQSISSGLSSGPSSVPSLGAKSVGGLPFGQTPSQSPFGAPKPEGQKTPIFGGGGGFIFNKDQKQPAKAPNFGTPITGGGLLSNPSFGEIGKTNPQTNQPTQQPQQNKLIFGPLGGTPSTNNPSVGPNQPISQNTTQISTTTPPTVPQTTTQTTPNFSGGLFPGSKPQGQTSGPFNFSNPSVKQPAKIPSTSAPSQQINSQPQQPPTTTTKPEVTKPLFGGLGAPTIQPQTTQPQTQTTQPQPQPQPQAQNQLIGGLFKKDDPGPNILGTSSQPQTTTTGSTSPLINIKPQDQNKSGQGKVATTINSQANQSQSTQPQVSQPPTQAQNQLMMIEQDYNSSNQSIRQYYEQWRTFQNEYLSQATRLLQKNKSLLKDREENYEIIENFKRLEPVIKNDKNQIQRKLKNIQQKQLQLMKILIEIEGSIETDIKPPRQSHIASQIKTCAQLSKQINVYDEKYGNEIEQDSSNQQIRNIFYNLDLVETQIKRLDHIVYHFFGELDN